MLLEELPVEPELIGSSHGQTLPINHVIVVLQYHIIQLMHQSQHDGKDEVDRVDEPVAVPHEENTCQERQCDQVYEAAVE